MYALLVRREIEELQSKLKEILYDCAVDVRATKAALYLYDQRDSRFELVTEYGFRGALRGLADRNDPVVDRCGRGRTAFFVNGLMAEPRFSEILYESSTDRMLVAPIYLRGQLVGFIDMRDKAAKQPFDTSDLPKAAKIADRVGELFVNKNLFGQRFIAVSTAPTEQPALTGPYSAAAMPGAATAAAPVALPRPLTGPHAVVAIAPVASRVADVVAQAEAAVKAMKAPSAVTVTDADIAVARDVVRLMLLIPGLVATAFSAGRVQEIAARGPIGDDAVTAIQGRIDAWLQKRGDGTFAPKRSVIAGGGAPVTAAEIQKVFTAPVHAAPLKGLYLTVAFATDPDRPAHDLLAAMHRQLQNAVEQSVQRRVGEAARLRIAEHLLEPDFAKYPELRRHTESVVRRVGQFARFLALSPAEIENARLVAIVHDAGMRLLDYDRLYRKRDLSHDELELLRNHAVVGAALVEPFLGPDIARAVLSHHERWDGGGYPHDIRGGEIPLLSRLLQICDVYESMTSAENYQNPQTHDQAMTVISRGAGIQFDPELAPRFVEMMGSAL